MKDEWRNQVKFLIAFTLAFLFQGLGRAPAYACTPPLGGLPSYTIADHVQRAPVVLEGVVISIDATPYGETADVQVRQYFKGSGPAAVRISNLGPTSVCLSPVAIGDHNIFYVQGDPNSGLRAVYLSQFDAVATADPNTIAQVEAATGVKPVVPQEPAGAVQNISVGAAALGGVAVGLVAGILVGAAGAFLVMRRSR